jgi:hypothetical protein
MDFSHALVDFFARAAIGAASVLAVIFLVGIGIRRSSTVTVRRTPR